MSATFTEPADRDASTRALLAVLGTAMIATGEPVNEVEEELALVGRRLGHPEVQIAATPTGVTLAFSTGGMASFESVGGSLRLDQASDVRRILYELLAGEVACPSPSPTCWP